MTVREGLRFVEPDDLAAEARALGPVEGFVHLVRDLPGRRGIGRRTAAEAAEALGLPDHLAFCLERLCALAERGEAPWPEAAHLDAVPFHDVCYGLLLPLAGLAPQRCQRVFGLRGPAQRLDAPGRRALVRSFLGRDDLGLSLVDKVALVRGDPFLGKPTGTSLNVLFDVLASVHLVSPSGLRQTLGRLGDLQEVFVQLCRRHRSDPPLTTREVLLTLRLLRGAPVARKRLVLRALVERMGRLERFFLVGFLRQGSRVSQTLGDDALIDAMAEVTGADRARLDVARSLVDVFELARLLEEEGAVGLGKLALRPLAPVAPMLAGPEVPQDLPLPTFFEKKYDGVRLMVHKATGEHGRVRAAAFTRRRLEWTEQLPGLLPLVQALPCRDAILDGELHGTVFGEHGPRPATVYDIIKSVRGEPGGPPVRYRYAVFDVLYLDGHDLTGLPFLQRRARLEQVARPLTVVPLPLPLEVSDGELVRSRPDMLRLYELFRAQGYEGGIAKAPDALYELGARSDRWTKLKPALTLDLAVTGALYTTSAEGPGGTFGTYLVSALTDGPSLVEVGRVQGLGALDSARVVQSILDEGLLTGRTLERDTSSGRKAGVELRPGVVATVRFDGIVRDDAGLLALRDPKILRVRTGEKDLSELDRVRTIEQLFQKQTMG
ncbi:MAG: ATP-dependent DNA ligase [Planctomycetota bacterium]|nr:ATP-dependent DNA ligase [Planctomycetota bacterium]